MYFISTQEYRCGSFCELTSKAAVLQYFCTHPRLTLRNIQLKSDSARMLHDLQRGGMCSHLGLQPLPDRRFTGTTIPMITFGRRGEMDTVCFSPLSIFKTWTEHDWVPGLTFESLSPSSGTGFAYGHTQANLANRLKLKTINNIR